MASGGWMPSYFSTLLYPDLPSSKLTEKIYDSATSCYYAEHTWTRQPVSRLREAMDLIKTSDPKPVREEEPKRTVVTKVRDGLPNQIKATAAKIRSNRWILRLMISLMDIRE